MKMDSKNKGAEKEKRSRDHCCFVYRYRPTHNTKREYRNSSLRAGPEKNKKVIHF